METLSQFRARVGSFNRSSLPPEGGMQTGAGLAAKIDGDGKIISFIGNTVIFSLPPDFVRVASAIQGKLYESCGDFLAERLGAETFHITLHDLINGKPSEGVRSEVARTEEAARKAVGEIRRECFTIRLRTTYLFNMVNTSVVLGFEPVDEESHIKLMGYYERFQDIVKLGYPLTPHMTAAYYKPGLIDEEKVKRLQAVFDYVSSLQPETVSLTGEMLSYSTFDDMKTYHLR